jgi:hypothetical protein
MCQLSFHYETEKAFTSILSNQSFPQSLNKKSKLMNELWLAIVANGCRRSHTD